MRLICKDWEGQALTKRPTMRGSHGDHASPPTQPIHLLSLPSYSTPITDAYLNQRKHTRCQVCCTPLPSNSRAMVDRSGLSFFSGRNHKLVAMGKSPGRWMKTLIFGKKKTRSKNPKPNNEKIEDKEIPVSIDQRTELKTEKNLPPANSQDDVCISATTELDAQNDYDRIREEQAAIDLQAALRGYLARRTLQTRKGIVRLQALMRGHSVRRQAISTLYCMFQIVKFQALARGRKARNSNIGVQVANRCNRLNHLIMSSVGVNTSMQTLKLSSNGFAQKILASSPSPTQMPLHFRYESNHANSVLSWLERWSASPCWQLLPKPVSGELSKPGKPHTRRSSLANVQNIASEFDKPIRHLRKISLDKPVNYIEEDPELVLERVKRNLRKVNGSVMQSTNDGIQKIITEPEKLRENEKEDEGVNERKKSRRAVWVPVKQESGENNEPLQIKRSVPGYMAPTVSAKAKLRSQDGPENANTLTRRHSLPSVTNGNISVSPMAKTTGKLMNDRSLQLSRDGNVSVKVIQPEWRR